MLNTITLFIENILDIVAQYCLYPAFIALDQILYFFFLLPMETVKMTLPLQVFIIACCTAFLSLYIRSKLQVREKEKLFLKSLTHKKKDQKQLELLDDWKLQKVLYEYSDNEIDEEFNTYIAQRFAQYGLSYLLPIFLIMGWLNHHFPRPLILERLGHEYILSLPENRWDLPGLHIPAIFFISYLGTIFLMSILKYFIRKHGELNIFTAFKKKNQTLHITYKN
ncbi:MAG: hypothetical protein OEM02_07165 [Desulfobulbaceae bacterium]|nr:hypothetical protein [Desulfobulbaceae bacterium]